MSVTHEYLEYSHNNKVSKTKGLDGKWYLWTVVVGDKKTNMYNPPVFVADDKKAYNEANDMDSDYFKSVYNSGINSLFQTIYSCEEMVCSAGEYLSKKESTKDFWRSGKEIIENASENLYKNMLEESPYPEVFKFYNTVFDVASIVYGGIGIVKSIASIPKLFTKGKKVVGIVQKSASITEDFTIGSGGAATLGGTRSISIAPGIIGEIADAISVSGSGVMAATGIYNMSGSPGGDNKFNAKKFEEQLVNMDKNDRVAIVKQKAKEVALERGLIKENKLTKINNRDVYIDPKTKERYTVDTRHARFEYLTKRGKHLGEVDFDFVYKGKQDKSGGHNLIVK